MPSFALAIAAEMAGRSAARRSTSRCSHESKYVMLGSAYTSLSASQYVSAFRDLRPLGYGVAESFAFSSAAAARAPVHALRHHRVRHLPLDEQRERRREERHVHAVELEQRHHRLVYGTTTTAGCAASCAYSKPPGYASSVRTKRSGAAPKVLRDAAADAVRRPLGGGGGVELRVELGGVVVVPREQHRLPRPRRVAERGDVAAERRDVLGLDARVVPDVLGVVQVVRRDDVPRVGGDRAQRAQPLAPAPPVLAAKLEVDRRDDDDRLVERHVQLAERRRVVAHEGVDVLQRRAGPAVGVEEGAPQRVRPAPARLAQVEGVALVDHAQPGAQLDARPPNVFAHAPENECSSTVWQSPCASHSERKTSRTSAIGAMWKSVLQKV